MARLAGVCTIVVAVSWACGTDTATQAPVRQPTERAESSYEAPAPTSIVETPADRSIRRELILAIDHDAELKDRDIRLIVTNGDVSVTGVVRTEAERKKINDLAMNIGGVKSVANALRVEE